MCARVVQSRHWYTLYICKNAPCPLSARLCGALKRIGLRFTEYVENGSFDWNPGMVLAKGSPVYSCYCSGGDELIWFLAPINDEGPWGLDLKCASGRVLMQPHSFSCSHPPGASGLFWSSMLSCWKCVVKPFFFFTSNLWPVLIALCDSRHCKLILSGVSGYRQIICIHFIFQGK